MKTFKEIRSLVEGKVTMARLKPGLKVNVIHKGRSAKNFGVDGQDVYGGKVKVLGMGIVPYGKKAEKRHIVGKDYKDIQKKYDSIWKDDDFRYGNYWNSMHKMKVFFDLIAEQDRKFKPGFVSWIWEVQEGENKRLLHYCFVSQDEKWEVTFLNKSAEFMLET